MLNLLMGVMLATVPLVNAPQNAITLQATDTTWTETQVVRLQADTNITSATAGSNYDVNCKGLQSQTVLCEVKSNGATWGPIVTLGYAPKADNSYRFDFTNSDSTVLPSSPAGMTQGIVLVNDGIPSGSSAEDTKTTTPDNSALAEKKTGINSFVLFGILTIIGLFSFSLLRKKED